jgi:hypothetical protein
MKRFTSYIPELFSSPTNPNTWSRVVVRTNDSANYKFTMAWLADGYALAPKCCKELLAFYEKNDIMIDLKWSTGVGKMYTYLKGSKVRSDDPTSLDGMSYLVGFTRLSAMGADYSGLFSLINPDIPPISKSVVWDNTYELWFSADNARVGFPNGKSKTFPANDLGWVCSSEDCLKGVDDDLGIMSGSSAISVFNTLLAIIEDFIKVKRPSAIIIGSKLGAKSARPAVYKRIAKMAAQKLGGTVYDLDQYRTPQARPGLMHGVLVTFNVSKDFFVMPK